MEKNFTFNYYGKAFTFFLPIPKDYIQKKIINTKTFYEVDLLEDVLKLPLNDGIICDVGANIGNHSIYFSSILKKKVYSFEPVKEMKDILEKNVILNNLEENIKIYELALGSDNSKGRMQIDPLNYGASTLKIVQDGDISISTLDSIINKEELVSLIKIDVEGFECEVIKGAKEVIKRCKPIIIAESQTQLDYFNISTLLKSLDYYPLSLKGATDTIIFVYKDFFKNEDSYIQSFLIRNDIVNVRKRIQGQNDQLSRKIDLLITGKIDLKESLTDIKNQIVKDQKEDILKLINSVEAVNNKMDSKESLTDIKNQIVKDQKEDILKLINSIEDVNNKMDSKESLTDIKNQIVKDQKEDILKSIYCVEDARKRIQGQNDQLSRKIDLILANKQDSKESLTEIKDQIIKNYNESVIKNKMEQELSSKKSENTELNNKLNKLLWSSNLISSNKLSNELTKLERNVRKVDELNKVFLKKIDVLYNSKIWRYTKIFRSLTGKKSQKIADYIDKVNNKYGNINEIDYNIKDSYNRLSTEITNIKQFQNNIKNLTSSKNETKLKRIERFSTLKGNTISNKIFVGIAAIPSREKALKETVSSLISQVDKMGVYLNGWDKIPEYLKNKKIEIIRSQDKGDIGDAGKFYWIDNHNGYYFTCDDDIVYPLTYVKRIIEKIKEYKFKSVIGWHGSLIIEPFENYYSSLSRRVFAFGSNRPDDTFVHILGTGTIGFHTSTIKVKLKDFIKPNMADVFFAELGQNQKVPFVVMKHKAKEMISIDSVQEDSINKHGINNVQSKKNTKEFQNNLVKKINWRLFNSNKLTILMIGRFETFTKGGIFKSNHLIKDTLITLGHKVISCDSQSEKLVLEKNIDLALIYPGDPNRPDFEQAEKKMTEIRNVGIPVCINISYNTNKDRNKEIVKRIKNYNINKKIAPVFLMTFTDISLSDNELNEINDFIVPLPKTIDGKSENETNVISYEDREGIVLGDATKLMNKDITGGDITPWIVACKKLLPHVKLYVFKQYSGKFDIPGVEAIPYMKEGFLEWTARRRIFVCLNEITTFEMTPTESQIVGTPVIFRPMPQSLSEYIGRSGISVSSPEEFAEMCFWLYNDKFAWESYSNLSLKNSQTNKLENLSIGLETSLRKVIFKTNKLRKDIEK